MALTPPPEAPQTNNPTTFAALADALIAWFSVFVAEINLVIVAMNLNSTNSTSTTSLTIATGTQTLTVQTAKSYQIGMSVKIASTANGANWMLGDITAYNTGTGSLTVQVSNINGSGGPLTAWTISQCAPKGAAPGVNNDITQLTGLTTPLSVAQGGCGLATGANLLKMAFSQSYIYTTTYTFTITSNVCVITHTGHNRIVGDKIYVSRSGTGPFAPGTDIPIGFYTINSIVSGVSYSFPVTAINATGPALISSFDVLLGGTIIQTSLLVANITFATAMANNRYSVVFNNNASWPVSISNKTTTGFTIIQSTNHTPNDFSVFGI